jgi:formate dehydrogenase major subunit/formate dehydrogenase alpha subunit
MAVIWAMGITQHIVGVRNVMDLANLQMLLGNMGVAGGGVNPLRGQNNVQGACDMGGLPNVYPAINCHSLKCTINSKSQATADNKVGLTVTEMMPGILEDKIEALYILGEDPVMSDPDTKHIRHCLEELDFFVLQEIFPSETAVYADVLLPGVSFAEKTGTFTNTERRVQMVNKAIEPLGDSRPDWWITAEIAKRMIFLLSSDGDKGESRKIDMAAPWAKWDYENTSQIMSEVNALTPSYGGITHERLLKGERLQWPCPTADHPGTQILHTKQFTRGKGKFMPIDHVPPAEKPDDNYPMVMSTGRVLYHWHGGEMTRRAKGLMEIYGQALVELNPADADRLGVNGNKTLRITSRRGSIEAQAWVTDRVPPGMVYANFHFPELANNDTTA